MPTLNLGILAHVDAGKTSLTERLLHHAGVIDELGSVDGGTTTTDSLDLERRRGITIRATVASFPIGDLTVNLVDTPGHPDFVAEVERALAVLDGAVLVLSAVEGVQAQTRVLMRALTRLRIPTLLFVNKIDRANADVDRVLDEIRARLTGSAVALTAVHRAVDGAAAGAAVLPRTGPRFTAELAETLAEHDDAVAAAYVDGEVAECSLRAALAVQTAAVAVHPVLHGSAITGAGVGELVDALATLLPTAAGDPAGPLAGTVFAVDRDPGGQRVAYVRLRSGTVRVRDRIPVAGVPARVTGVEPVDGGPPDELTAGRIGRLHGLVRARIGDAVGAVAAPAPARQFPAPGLEAVVEARDPADRLALRTALVRLAEQDPLIDLRQDDARGELSVSLYGEVQREVVEATLAADFGVAVAFRPVSPICVERPVGTGTAVEVMHAPENPFLATVGLRVEPGPPGSAVAYGIEVELGSMPFAFLRAVEETVHATLREGLRGWPVTDVRVTLTRSGYSARQSHAHAVFDKSMSSTAGDFRLLTPLVVMTALRQAGTEVLEPVERFRLEVPTAALTALWPVLARLEAVPEPPVDDGPDTVAVAGTIPTMRVRELAGRLAGLTGGAGLLETQPHGHRPARGEPPRRARTDHDPLDRRRYLLRVTRRAGR